MKKRMLLFALVALVTLSAVMLVQAADSSDNVVSNDAYIIRNLRMDVDDPPKVWKISLNARVVSNQGDSLVVYIKSPQNMVVEDGDTTGNLQTLPIDKDSKALDSQGNDIPLNTILPGQEVKVTFRYSWLNGSPRTAFIVNLVDVTLKDEALKAKSTLKTADFDTEVLVGTVLSNQEGQLEVYVEYGRVYSGSTEYIVRGRKWVSLAKGASVVDSQGKALTLESIKPFQRVSMKVKDAMWMESYPPIFSPNTVSRIEVFGDRENMLSVDELSKIYQVNCTVLRTQRDAGGNLQLVVQPDEGSRERGFAAEYVMPKTFGGVYTQSGAATSFEAIQPGARLSVQYEGLIYGDDRAEIPWYQRIDMIG